METGVANGETAIDIARTDCPTGDDAEVDSATAHGVEGAEFLGQHDRVARGEDEDAGGEAQSGGVGGAKLALGVSRILAPAQLDGIVNTGDDFEHLGLTICPDLDTLTYTLAGLNNTESVCGRAG